MEGYSHRSTVLPNWLRATQKHVVAAVVAAVVAVVAAVGAVAAVVVATVVGAAADGKPYKANVKWAITIAIFAAVASPPLCSCM